MVEILLICIVVVLTLNLLIDLSTWSKTSALYNRFMFWLRR